MPPLQRQSSAQQLTQALEAHIRSGQWAAGMKVPPVRDLAEAFEVGVNTAYQAVQALQSRGLIHRPVAGGLAFVADRPGEEGTPLNPARPANNAGRRIAILGSTAATVHGPQPDNWQTPILASLETTLTQSTGARAHELIHLSGRPAEPVRHHASLLAQLQPMTGDLAGVILLSANDASALELLNTFDRWDLPWVSINRPTLQTTHNFVSAHYTGIGRMIGQCFRELQRQRILILSPVLQETTWSIEKIAGLTSALLEDGVDLAGLRPMRTASAYPEAGRETTLQYIDRFGPPEAIFATGDYLALGAIQACQERGLRVPEDVVVAGSTGLAFTAWTAPPLSLVAQPLAEIGTQAAAMLLSMIDSGQRRCPGRQLPGELVIRQSMPLAEEIARRIQAQARLTADAPPRQTPQNSAADRSAAPAPSSRKRS